MSQESNGRVCMVQGRIVWTAGDLFTGRAKVDQNTKQPRVNAQGQPMKEFGFGIAVPKSEFARCGPGEPGEIWTVIQEEARAIYPNGLPPGFAMKFKDGDGVDHNGQPFNTREGYAGHLIFALTTSLPIKYFKFEAGNNVLINSGIKCGDYVQVQVQVKAHGPNGQSKPGLYLNPMAVRLLGYGTEIVNTPSGDVIFGMSAPVVPQGASATPLAPAGGFPAQPGFAPAPAPQFGPQMQPQQYAQPAAPQPYHQVLPPQFQPPAGGPPLPNGFAPAAPAYPSPQPPMNAPGAYPTNPGFPPPPR